jgi:hypothetical protein
MMQLTDREWREKACRLVVDPRSGDAESYVIDQITTDLKLVLSPVTIIPEAERTKLERLRELEGAREVAYLQGDYGKDIDLAIECILLRWELFPETRPVKG